MSRTAVSVRNVDRYIHQMSFHIAQHAFWTSRLNGPARPCPPRLPRSRRDVGRRGGFGSRGA